jgi:hypothetical protein
MVLRTSFEYGEQRELRPSLRCPALYKNVVRQCSTLDCDNGSRCYTVEFSIGVDTGSLWDSFIGVASCDDHTVDQGRLRTYGLRTAGSIPPVTPL